MFGEPRPFAGEIPLVMVEINETSDMLSISGERIRDEQVSDGLEEGRIINFMNW